MREPTNSLVDPDVEELEALGRVANAFQQYYADAKLEIDRWEWNYSILSEEHKRLVGHLPAKIATVQQCAYQNQLLFNQILDENETLSTAPEPMCEAGSAAELWRSKYRDVVHPADAEKVKYVLKNLVRDWSEEGVSEREQSYGIIIREIKDIFEDRLGLPPTNKSSDDEENSLPRVLVPGCGLARLCVELAGIGFEALGNEFSYFMLLASNLILNHTGRAEQWATFPWALNCSNHLSDGDQLRPVLVPDIEPVEIVGDRGRLGMAAGDFVEVFENEEFKKHFDAVVTCFFLDTAHNPIAYMETIYKVLKPGGWWIHLGPLQWHWTDAHTYLDGNEQSLELTLNDIQKIAIGMGFKFDKRQVGIPCQYMANIQGMAQQTYKCAFWTAQKSDTQYE